jgi:hypothetical protein
MSEITETHAAWVPPPFPPQGRLPGRALQVGQNCHQQNSDERRYHQELCLAAGRRVEPPCCKTLHISLFFDGTGNNLNHDFFIATRSIRPISPGCFVPLLERERLAGCLMRASCLLDAEGRAEENILNFICPAWAPVPGSE